MRSEEHAYLVELLALVLVELLLEAEVWVGDAPGTADGLERFPPVEAGHRHHVRHRDGHAARHPGQAAGQRYIRTDSRRTPDPFKEGGHSAEDST